MAKTVVILGGSYAGVHVAHYVLKNTSDTKVILVSKNSHFYVNLASVRAIIPDTFDDSQLFAPLTDFFAKYPKDRVEVVVGTAEKVDTDAKTVAVAAAASSRTLAYDQLVLATGARSNVAASGDASIAVPWKADGTYEDIVALLHATRSKVAAAKHIVVAGGGITGSEVAADLGAAYGRKPADKGGKTIVLLSAGAALLGGDAVAGTVASTLKSFGVDVRTGQTVTAVRTLPDGTTELTVTSAADAAKTTTLVTDLYLPAVGQLPNSAYLDAALLRAGGYVDVDAFYRAAAVASHDVWALGDVVSRPRASFVYTQKQAAAVGKNVVLALQGKPPAPVKLFPFDIVTVSLGPAAGTGHMGWVRMPSFMIANLKSRRLGTQMLPDYISGSIA